MRLRSASPSPRIRSEFAVCIGEKHGHFLICRRLDALGLLAALRPEFRRLALTFRLHAAVDRLAVRLGKVRAPYAHVHDLDAQITNIVIYLLDRLLHERVALIADDIDEGRPAEHTSNGGIDNGG